VSIAKPSVGYWVVSSTLLLWGLAYAFLVIFTFVLSSTEDWAELVASGVIRQEYADYIARIPAWVIAVTEIVAVTRLLGAVALLFRRSWAFPVYVASMILVFIIMYRGFVLANVASVIRSSQVGVEILFIALSIFAVWFAHRAKSRGLIQ
jgi:hypothetical protein